MKVNELTQYIEVVTGWMIEVVELNFQQGQEIVLFSKHSGPF
jgi:hypothetical protein